MKATKNGIKKGDMVICVDDQFFKQCWDKAPQQNKEYKVISVDGNFIWLDGFDFGLCWNSEFFKPKDSLITKLAKSLVASLLVQERPDNRIFILNAKF